MHKTTFLRTTLSALRRAKEGAVAPLIGLCVLMLVVAAGSAVDAARAQLVQAKLSMALDAAGLAAGAYISTAPPKSNGGPSSTSSSSSQVDMAAVKAEVNKYLNANFPANYLGSNITSVTTDISSDNNTITLNATASVPTEFMQLINVRHVDVMANAQIKRNSNDIEIALVLDNTGSMGLGNKLPSLKSAAAALVNTLFGNQQNSGNIYISLVPFDVGVKIGTQHVDWIKSYDHNQDYFLYYGGFAADRDDDLKYQNTSADTNDNPPLNDTDRFRPQWQDIQTVSATAGHDWGDWTDSGINNGMGDDPYDNYNENWIWDAQHATGGTCTGGGCGTWVYTQQTCTWNYPSCTVVNNCPPRSETGCTPPAPDPNCGQSVQYDCSSWSCAPNTQLPQTCDPYVCHQDYYWQCRSIDHPLQPLQFAVQNKTQILNAIYSMQAAGSTRINVGFMWGWNTLSTRWQGLWDSTRPYLPLDNTDPTITRKKVLILMTDGENTVYYNNDDARLAQLCTNAKAQGIIVYTIGYSSTDPIDPNLLRNCATDDAHFFDAPSDQQLVAAFKTIANQLTNLRISQ